MESPRSAAGAPVFRCPACEEPLPRQGPGYRCSEGHAYDVAKEGYVNLLLAQHRSSKDPGYSKEMIAGRRDFFDAGHYEPLADGVAEVVAGYLPEGSATVLDAGCGEGYYLRRLREHLSAQPLGRDHLLVGTDVSKHAVRVAAKRDPLGTYAVAGTFRMPILADRVDLLLTHFSPVSPADFRRVVRPGGVVLVGGPGERHLFSFKELLYDEAVTHEPGDALAGEPGFEPVGVHHVRYPLRLRGPGQVANLLQMTPYNWSVAPDLRESLTGLDSLDTEVDVLVRAYRVV
ncbi:putative RNA methyltransferase [Antribacter gilvus]|uniref:putative RNA methyltransferase n=1 Tax=Antribacter gilvus TaxID=2304675 RepID=UPI000F7B7C98|nr:methyltransferase domain-containing protein [Antribacter gilvus]